MYKNSSKLLNDITNLSSGILSKCVYDKSAVELKEYKKLDIIHAEFIDFYLKYDDDFKESSNWMDVWEVFKDSDEYAMALDKAAHLNKKTSSIPPNTLKVFKFIYSHFYAKNKMADSEVRNYIIENDLRQEDLPEIEDNISKYALKVAANPMSVYDKKELLLYLQVKEGLAKMKEEESRVNAGIKKSPKGLYQVTDSEGHVLPSNPKSSKGTGHKTRESAEKQLRAIEISKHKESGHVYSPMSSPLEDLLTAIANFSGFHMVNFSAEIKGTQDQKLISLWEDIRDTLSKPVVNGMSIHEVLKKVQVGDALVRNPKFLHGVVTYCKGFLEFAKPRFDRISVALENFYNKPYKQKLEKFIKDAEDTYRETVRLMHSQESILKKRKQSSKKVLSMDSNDPFVINSKYVLIDKLTKVQNFVEKEYHGNWLSGMTRETNDTFHSFISYLNGVMSLHGNSLLLHEGKETEARRLLSSIYQSLNTRYEDISAALFNDPSVLDSKREWFVERLSYLLMDLHKESKKASFSRKQSSLKKAIKMSKENSVKICLEDRKVAHNIQDALSEFGIHSEIIVPSGDKKCTLMFGDKARHAAIAKAIKGILNDTPNPSKAKLVSALKKLESIPAAKKASSPLLDLLSQVQEEIADGYKKALLWTSTDLDSEEGAFVNLDANYSVEDFSEEAESQIKQDIHDFCVKAWKAVGAQLEDFDPEQVGHDFWLTRNGHGAGFWDGDYPDEIGKELTRIAKEFRSLDPYAGDDGKIYLSGWRKTAAKAKKAAIDNEATIAMIDSLEQAYQDILKNNHNANKIATNLGDLLGDIESFAPKLESSKRFQRIANTVSINYESLINQGAIDYNAED